MAVRGDHLRLRGHDDLAINADVGNAAATPTLPVEPRRARTHGTCDVGDWTQPSLSGTRQEGCISVSRMRVVSPRERVTRSLVADRQLSFNLHPGAPPPHKHKECAPPRSGSTWGNFYACGRRRQRVLVTETVIKTAPAAPPALPTYLSMSPGPAYAFAIWLHGPWSWRLESMEIRMRLESMEIGVHGRVAYV